MYLKCAHPDCRSDFEHGSGRLFRLHQFPRHEQQPSHWHGVKHFWLCAGCCQVYTIEEHKALGVLLVQRHETLTGGDPFYYVLQREVVAQPPLRKRVKPVMRRQRKSRQSQTGLESVVANVV